MNAFARTLSSLCEEALRKSRIKTKREMEPLKSSVAFVVSKVGDKILSENCFLAVQDSDIPLDQVKEIYLRLSEPEQARVHGKVWELAKMVDPRISGWEWGKNHCMHDEIRLRKALHRLGHLHPNGLFPLRCLKYSFGEGGLGSQYFSFGERKGIDPLHGWVALVNGMGIQSLEHAGSDAVTYAGEYDIHCVYNSTHQVGGTDLVGFAKDVTRMKAVDGGSYSRTTYLVAQQICDLLAFDPNKRVLQIGISEGAAHVNAALRLLQSACTHLLPRISVILFAPAFFIKPNAFPQVELVTFAKLEDSTVCPWGTNATKITKLNNVVIVPHTSNSNPHDHRTPEYREASWPYLERFYRTGRIF